MSVVDTILVIALAALIFAGLKWWCRGKRVADPTDIDWQP